MTAIDLITKWCNTLKNNINKCISIFISGYDSKVNSDKANTLIELKDDKNNSIIDMTDSASYSTGDFDLNKLATDYADRLQNYSENQALDVYTIKATANFILSINQACRLRYSTRTIAYVSVLNRYKALAANDLDMIVNTIKAR